MRTLVCNVRPLRFSGVSGEIRGGTKHFVGDSALFAKNYRVKSDRYEVVGYHRETKRLVTSVVAAKHLYNWRSKVVYSPAVIGRLSGDSTFSRQPTFSTNPREIEALNARRYLYAYLRDASALEACLHAWQAAGHHGASELLDQREMWGAIAYVNEPGSPIGVAKILHDTSIVSCILPGYEQLNDRKTTKQRLHAVLRGRAGPSSLPSTAPT